ncbi:MAG: putative 4-hydroxy-4-methyl-2-oxoglutarate aldolase, partial [Rhodobiaceae bacterium]|nr:putative 4-hydroxy-4-methyl-2-oxoglutarate aldolase [Rhodobiaceae bacterium]
LASHPKKSEKRDLGTYDEVLEFSGVTIRPGDYIYADEDGVVIAETALSV